jgi:xyloglucan-specific endo-beta-1,4-glucanase
MKLSLLTLASTVAFALAVPTATIQKRADYCGQWDSAITGTYTVYNVRHPYPSLLPESSTNR